MRTPELLEAGRVPRPGRDANDPQRIVARIGLDERGELGREIVALHAMIPFPVLCREPHTEHRNQYAVGIRNVVVEVLLPPRVLRAVLLFHPHPQLRGAGFTSPRGPRGEQHRKRLPGAPLRFARCTRAGLRIQIQARSPRPSSLPPCNRSVRSPWSPARPSHGARTAAAVVAVSLQLRARAGGARRVASGGSYAILRVPASRPGSSLRGGCAGPARGACGGNAGADGTPPGTSVTGKRRGGSYDPRDARCTTSR
jgi:hypothetical protein